MPLPSSPPLANHLVSYFVVVVLAYKHRERSGKQPHPDGEEETESRRTHRLPKLENNFPYPCILPDIILTQNVPFDLLNTLVDYNTLAQGILDWPVQLASLA